MVVGVIGGDCGVAMVTIPTLVFGVDFGVLGVVRELCGVMVCGDMVRKGLGGVDCDGVVWCDAWCVSLFGVMLLIVV